MLETLETQMIETFYQILFVECCLFSCNRLLFFLTSDWNLLIYSLYVNTYVQYIKHCCGYYEENNKRKIKEREKKFNFQKLGFLKIVNFILF